MKFIIIFLVSSFMLFNACTKYEGSNPLPDQTRRPAVNTTPDYLVGREFIFDSLEWVDNDFGYPAYYLIDSNLFQPGRQISVTIKHDTSGVWEMVYSHHLSVGVLFVSPNPPQPAFIGKRFSLKVKF